MKERLTKLIKEAQERYIYAEEQARYLIENGVIVPPCKVGDAVYMPWEFDENKGIAILEVIGIDFHYEYGFIKTDLFSDCDEFLSRYNYGRFGFSDFGKTVFLTREEAERALKGGGEE